MNSQKFMNIIEKNKTDKNQQQHVFRVLHIHILLLYRLPTYNIFDF